jgi:hypothetical protein
LPRYFFHTQNFVQTTDHEGMELADGMAARHAGIRSAGELMRNGAEQFWGSRPWLVTITDDTGLILYEIEMDGRASPAVSVK